ncbi:MAG: AsnC family transcriptional regulator [Halanaerobiales bacterium]
MIDKLDKQIIRKLQENLPLVLEPYKQIADELGIPEEKLLKRITKLKEKGYLKRISALVKHRDVGYKANVMVAWDIPDDKIENFVNKTISLPIISHFYERERYKSWPYNIYTMIHCKTLDEVENAIEDILDAVGDYKYEMLLSTKELKKTSVKYFTE